MKKYYPFIAGGLLYWLIEKVLLFLTHIVHLGELPAIFLFYFLMPLLFGFVLMTVINEQKFIGSVYSAISIFLYFLIISIDTLFFLPKKFNPLEIILELFLYKGIILIFISVFSGLIAIYLKRRKSKKSMLQDKRQNGKGNDSIKREK